MNNPWNKFVYKIGSPFYDKFFNSGIFLHARKQIFQSLSFETNQKVLFVGVGTGADLELVHPSNLEITAIDYSPDMLEKARKKFRHSSITFIEMDAQQMPFADESFDYIVASLILSVVPDANKCFQEMTRVLKREGKILIFDKFVSQNHKLSLPKMLLRPMIRVLGTDIGRNFEELMLHHVTKVKVEEDVPIMWNGMYRKIIVRKI